MYELIDKRTEEVIHSAFAYAELEKNADPRYYAIRNTDTGMEWDNWEWNDPDDFSGA